VVAVAVVEVADRQVAKVAAALVLSQVMVVIMEHPLQVAQGLVLVELEEHVELEAQMVQIIPIVVDLVVQPDQL
jgi:hypothetical protein